MVNRSIHGRHAAEAADLLRGQPAALDERHHSRAHGGAQALGRGKPGVDGRGGQRGGLGVGVVVGVDGGLADDAAGGRGGVGVEHEAEGGQDRAGSVGRASGHDQGKQRAQRRRLRYHTREPQQMWECECERVQETVKGLECDCIVLTMRNIER